MILVVSTLHKREEDKLFFRQLRSLVYPESVLVWGGSYCDISLHWDLGKEKYNSDNCIPERVLDCIDLAKYERRLTELNGISYEYMDANEIINRHALLSYDFLNKYKPRLVMALNPLIPHTGIPFDLAKVMGVNVLTFERGHIPGSFLVDKGGYGGFSELSQLSLSALISKHDKEKYRHLGNSIVQKQKESSNERGATITKRHDFSISNFLEGTSKDLRVLVIGMADINTAMIPCDHPDRFINSPGFSSSLALVHEVSKLHEGVTFYKPHPNTYHLIKQQEIGENIFITTDNVEELISACDVIVLNGSSLEFASLVKEKPTILCGKTLMSGKDICYEAYHNKDLPKAMEYCLKRFEFEKKNDNFKTYCGWLYENAYILPNVNNWPSEVIREIVAQENIDNHKLLIESGTPYESVSECLEKDVVLAVLDFDHTLLLGNSTELYISNAKPRLLAEIIDKTVARVSRRLSSRLPDRARVLAISILLPWSILFWRKSADKISRERLNWPLWEAVNAKVGDRIIIVSNGFSVLISPLLKRCACLGYKYPSLIASDLLPGGRDIRTEGKVSAIEKNYPDVEWRKAVGVTDSLEDLDLLEKSGQSVLTRWNEPRMKATLGYFPFRYVSQGKYPAHEYVSGQIFGQDLIIWLVLFVKELPDLFPVFLFFVSFYAIYEIGYYENDIKASREETTPTLSGSQGHFECYSINIYGWLTALITSGAGFVLLNINQAYLSFLLWMIFLVFLRVVFFTYNSKPPEKRIPYYILLQFLKNYGGLVVLIPTTTGLILALSHLFQHTVVYIIYRCGGDKTKFKRALNRLIFFCLGSVCLYFSGISQPIAYFAVALVWLLYQVIITDLGLSRWSAQSILRKLFSLCRNFTQQLIQSSFKVRR